MTKNSIYIAGPMRGYPNFNFEAFHTAEEQFKQRGWDVFNPARKDEEQYGKDFNDNNPDGDLDQAIAEGFSMRVALFQDTKFICNHATHIFMLRGWENSAGARAEHSLAVALGHEILYQGAL